MRISIAGPQMLRGQIKPPSSKAYTHRALIASMLARGKSMIKRPLLSDDTIRTLDSIQEMGARIHETKDLIEVLGVGIPSSPSKYLDCADSGATLRFLAAVATTGTEKMSFTTKTSLASRPIDPLLAALTKLGAHVDLHRENNVLRVTVQGPLKGGETSIPGNISSQFISALLFAAPLARNDVTIRIEGNLESQPYIQLTSTILSIHGITVSQEEGRFHVPARQEYRPATHEVPTDCSSVAFILAAGATVGDRITLTNIHSAHDLEPDSVIMELLPQIGVKIDRIDGGLTASKSTLSSFQFEASDHPDLVPALEVLAAQAIGKTSITGVKRLRYKESDRLITMPAELTKMGARIKIEEDRVTIDGVDHLSPSEMSSHNDHRVAMGCTVAALAARGKSAVADAEVVSKSYPAFFSDLESLGAKFNVE